MIIILIILVLLIIIFVGKLFISEEKGFWDELKGELAAKKLGEGALTTGSPDVIGSPDIIEGPDYCDDHVATETGLPCNNKIDVFLGKTPDNDDEKAGEDIQEAAFKNLSKLGNCLPF